MSGIVLVLQGPSGVGKSTVRAEVQKYEARAVFSISATTRLPRTDEIDGVEYHFESLDRFEKLLREGAFAEWTCYKGNLYGTLKEEIDGFLEADKIVLAELDSVGAQSFKRLWPEQCDSILLLPPTWEELERRLRHRGTDSEAVIQERLQSAIAEIREGLESTDYVVVNRWLATSMAAVLFISRIRLARAKGEPYGSADLLCERYLGHGGFGHNHWRKVLRPTSPI